MDILIEDLSGYLFWDMDAKKIDWKSHADLIVRRVLEYGQLSDWIAICNVYGLQKITEIAKSLRDLDPVALNFVATITSTPIESFRCYTNKLSTPPHWNF